MRTTYNCGGDFDSTFPLRLGISKPTSFIKRKYNYFFVLRLLNFNVCESAATAKVDFGAETYSERCWLYLRKRSTESTCNALPSCVILTRYVVFLILILLYSFYPPCLIYFPQRVSLLLYSTFYHFELSQLNLIFEDILQCHS